MRWHVATTSSRATVQTISDWRSVRHRDPATRHLAGARPVMIEIRQDGIRTEASVQALAGTGCQRLPTNRGSRAGHPACVSVGARSIDQALRAVPDRRFTGASTGRCVRRPAAAFAGMPAARGCRHPGHPGRQPAPTITSPLSTRTGPPAAVACRPQYRYRRSCRHR